MLSEQTVENDFQMEFAHAGNNSLSGFFIAAHIECRIFFGQTAETFIQFVAVSGGFGFNRDGNNRFREAHGFKHNRNVFQTDSIAGSYVLKPDGCCNVTAVYNRAFLT